MKYLTSSIFILVVIYAVNGENLIFEPNKENFAENESVMLTCKPEIESIYCKWYRNSQEITCESNHRYKIGASDSCTLNITLLTLDDDAWWSCNSENSSSTFSKRLAIEIKPPVLLIPSQPVSVLGEDGKIADLQCLFDSTAPSCYWLKNSEMVAIRGRYQYIGNKQKGDCSIRVDNVNWRDGGQWQCCYPLVDKWPVIESPMITLNIIVVPRNPIITFNGIQLGNEAEIFLSTQITKFITKATPRIDEMERIQTEEEITKNKLNDTILCWSINGFPTAQLSWNMENEYGTQLSYLDYYSTSHTWDAVRSKNLKTTNVQLLLNNVKFDGVQKIKAVCSAAHSSYKELNRTTFIWLTWANRIIENVVEDIQQN